MCSDHECACYDDHAKCNAEIARLEAELAEARRAAATMPECVRQLLDRSDEMTANLSYTDAADVLDAIKAVEAHYKETSHE